MKLCRFVLFAMGAMAYAQNITGRWVGPATTADNGMEIVVAVKQAPDGALSGYIMGRTTDMITGGKVEGSNVTIECERPGRGGAPQKVTYTAAIEGTKMKLTLPQFGGRGPGAGRGPGGDAQKAPPKAPPAPTVLELARVSTEAPAPLPPRPAPVTLPAPEAVKSNGLGKTPPMGWNSWNKFRNQVSDKMVREIADAMVSSGMKSAGYVYVNIDDTWESAHRDAQGNITTNNKFPDMKALADYVHSKGLKLGIYSSPGPKTCAGYEGTYQHEEQDAKQFAKWGIDYLKYDWCSASQVYDNTRDTMVAAYAKMGNALLNSGRKIFYSLCQYGNHNVEEWGERVGGNLWRTTGDINDSWASMERIGFEGTSNPQQVGKAPDRAKFAGPGHFNDPDMLEIGNGRMTNDEYKTHMSLWSIQAAALLAGNDIRSLDQATKDILLNREVIAVDQDKLGKQGTRKARVGDTEVWSKPLADGSQAVGLFNRGGDSAKVVAKWSDLGLKGSHTVHDLWKHADLGKKSDSFEAIVPSHGVVMVKVK
ncbi:MAG TPA: glycoside hydrolase family 27 protein [Candidatus Solibacter sp.]|nr:glycoside hydrolase family 27 protein [Candidatus Solibacter sp.]